MLNPLWKFHSPQTQCHLLFLKATLIVTLQDKCFIKLLCLQTSSNLHFCITVREKKENLFNLLPCYNAHIVEKRQHMCFVLVSTPFWLPQILSPFFHWNSKMNTTDSVTINNKIVHLESEVSKHVQTQHPFIPFHKRTILILIICL